MKYKKANDVEEIVKKDYSKKIYFSGGDFTEKGHLFQTVTIPPKTKQREHWHDKQTEVLFILKGECHIFLNGKDHLAKPGDAFICSLGVKHNLWNKTDDVLPRPYSRGFLLFIEDDISGSIHPTS